MLIKQTRIMNLSKLNFLDEGTTFRIGIRNTNEYIDELKEIGFDFPLEEGMKILPKKIGSVTGRNANGDYIIHKDKEKETHYRMIEWTYNQWAGNGETVEVTESKAVPYERYPRTFVPPQGVELIVVKKEDFIIISPELLYSQENKEEIIHTVNLFLEIFGQCLVLDNNENEITMPKIKRLNWEVLPQGKMPWEKRKNQLRKFIDRANGTNRKVISKRLEEINNYNPDFTAVGNGGFNGYIIYGFENTNIYVLESIHVNNATYVLQEDWEEISKLSKAEILKDELHEDRIIHNESWYKKIRSVLDEELK